jgi:hypothetical protein
MAIVDEHGRLFGRLNVVDAVVAVFVLGLIPLLYGAAILFQTPPPKVTAVVPAAVAAGTGQRVTIRGEHLRPYMRVSFGTTQAKNFLFKSEHEAEVELNDMTPGVYDVVLYDVSQEQSRLPKAFTLLPSPLPPTTITLVGVFGNLDAERARQLTPGTTVAGVGIIRAVGEPMPARVRVNANGLVVEIPVERALMLPAEVEAGCHMLPKDGVPYCQQAGVSLHPTLLLMGEHEVGRLPFQIDQLRGPAPPEPIEVVARFTAAKSVIAAIRVGDVDAGGYMNPLAAGATVTGITIKPFNEDLVVADVTLKVRAERGSAGWVYSSVPIRAGGEMPFFNARYQLSGLVLRITPEWRPSK